MPKVRHVLEALEKIAPTRYAFSFDRVGLQVGDSNADVTKAVVSLDRSLGAVRYAAEQKAQMLVSHHPLIFEPLSAVVSTSNAGRTVMELIKNGIAFAAAHTNWDSAQGGINDALAQIFELQNVESFGTGAEVSRLKLIVYSPPEVVEKIIDAATAAGAGIIGDYTRCAYKIPGEGTFVGGPDSNPVVGEAGEVVNTAETRIEMALPVDAAKAVAKAIRTVHPYEEPAYDFMPLVPEQEQPAGRIGTLSAPLIFSDVLRLATQKLDTVAQGWGDPARRIKKLALVGGAADSEWRMAQRAGADALITGEVKQHVGLEASEEGFAIVAAGHYATENPGCRTLKDRLAKEMDSIEWLAYEPEPGFSGRPLNMDGR